MILDDLFCAQSDEFLSITLDESNFRWENDFLNTQIMPLKIDFECISDTLIKTITQHYLKHGFVLYEIVNNNINNIHPIFKLSRVLSDGCGFNNFIKYPFQNDAEVVENFNHCDGTVKVYNSESVKSSVGMSTGYLAPHQDGMGNAGKIETIFTHCEQSALKGGASNIHNFIHITLDLALQDMEAFKSLFLPDALTYYRTGEQKPLKVVSPILYLNEINQPSVNFKISNSVHKVKYRNVQPLKRAIEFIDSKIYGQGIYKKSFFMKKNMGTIINNRYMLHSREIFIDSAIPKNKRLLSTAWFTRDLLHKEYMLAPGISIKNEYASLFPEYFGDDKLVGNWRYNSLSKKNELIG